MTKRHVLQSSRFRAKRIPKCLISPSLTLIAQCAGFRSHAKLSHSSRNGLTLLGGFGRGAMSQPRQRTLSSPDAVELFTPSSASAGLFPRSPPPQRQAQTRHRQVCQQLRGKMIHRKDLNESPRSSPPLPIGARPVAGSPRARPPILAPLGYGLGPANLADEEEGRGQDSEQGRTNARGRTTAFTSGRNRLKGGSLAKCASHARCAWHNRQDHPAWGR